MKKGKERQIERRKEGRKPECNCDRIKVRKKERTIEGKEERRKEQQNNRMKEQQNKRMKQGKNERMKD